MSAPAGAYHSTVLRNETDSQDYQVAKIGYSAEYDTVAKVKEKFYLDDIVFIDTLDPDGFTGIVRTAFNLGMHALARKADIGDGKFMLRDAGLNTLGKVTVGSYPNTSMTQDDAIENTFRLVVTLLTAFYTSNHTWRIKVKSIGCASSSNPAHYTDASFLVLDLGSLSNNTTYTYNPAYIQIGNLEDPDAYLFTAPNRYEIWVELLNDEGTFSVQADTLTAVSFPVSLKYSSSSFLDAAMSGGTGTYYKNTAKHNSYTYLFTNSASSSVASGGYYVASRVGTEQYTVSYEVSSTGQIIGVNVFDWHTIRTSRDYFGFEGTNSEDGFKLQLAYDEAVNNSWSSLGTIYESYDGLYYYVASTGSTYIANGYYMLAYGYDLASSGWMRIYNGEVVQTS